MTSIYASVKTVVLVVPSLVYLVGVYPLHQFIPASFDCFRFDVFFFNQLAGVMYVCPKQTFYSKQYTRRSSACMSKVLFMHSYEYLLLLL